MSNTTVQAPPEATTTTTQDRSTEFVAVEGGGETTSAAGLLVAAYTVMWVLVFVFIWFTAKRQRLLDSRLSEIETGLARFEGNAHERP